MPSGVRNPPRQDDCLQALTIISDREEALRDDFHLESTYDYPDEDEWDEDESTWNEEAEPQEEESTEIKDESKAYLDFLNDEVRFAFL